MYKKILILANSSTGLYHFRTELISELLKTSEVFISVPDGLTNKDLENLGCKLIITDVDRRGVNPLTDAKLFFKYKQILKSIKPDLVIAYTIKPDIYGGFACRTAKIPFAANITGLGSSFQKNDLLHKLVVMLYKVGLKKAKCVFFENSENMNIFLDEHIIKKEQSVLLNGAGVNLEKFSYIEYPPESDETRFLFVGRVMKEKGVNELFAACKMLLDEGYNISLDVLGGYEENYEEIIKQYEAEGWLHYHGYVLDVRPYIANCHCFVLPSWHEGMANTNLECAASGRPVITSRIHGCMESVIENESGFLCENKNIDDLHKALTQICELPYKKRMTMGFAGRKLMKEEFDKDIVVDKTISFLLRDEDGNE